MSSSHHRKTPSRAPLPRRTTRGPLDLDDPLSASKASDVLSARTHSPATRSGQPDLSGELIPKARSPDVSLNPAAATTSNKDLSFLLDASIYHPLGQIDTPAAFRQPFAPPPSPNTSIAQVFTDIETLLAGCNFIGAAHLSGLVLTSGIVSPTDADSIFHLLSIRYSSLELCGNVLLAAQEAKALEDLSSTFYYVDETLPDRTANLADEHRPPPQNVVPFDLRLQALRLQSIGFSDSRRGISALYDLGTECRDHIASPLTNQNEIQMWAKRLDEVGVRVVNALIEQGDLDCAYRTLQSMKPDSSSSALLWTSRMVLLCIKMGKIDEAQGLLLSSQIEDPNRMLFDSLLIVAKGDYEQAAQLLSRKLDSDSDRALRSIAEQNLACAYLYAGQISKCREILEGLVDSQHSFQTLTINLATIYELTSDKALDLKVTMANKIAAGSKSTGLPRGYVNSDFKL